MKSSLTRWLVLSVSMLIILLIGMPQAAYAADYTYNLSPGGSAEVSSKDGKSITAKMKGPTYDYAETSATKGVIGYGRSKRSSSRMVTGDERLTITNTSNDTVTITVDDSKASIYYSSTPALVNKWLQPGDSAEISNKGITDEYFHVDGKNDHADYDENNALISFDENHSGGQMSLKMGRKIAITNRDKEAIEIYAPYFSFKMETRLKPAVFHKYIATNQTLELNKRDGSDFYIYLRVPKGTRQYDYVSYLNSELKGYGSSSNTNWRISEKEKFVITNKASELLEVYGPTDGFHLYDRDDYAMETKVLKKGESMQITNTSAESRSLTLRGTYDFAEYDIHGKVVDFEKGAFSSSKSIGASNKMVITNNSASDMEIVAPKQGFTYVSSPNPALVVKEIAPNQSIAGANGTTGRASIKLNGLFDYATYDTLGMIQTYNQNRSIAQLYVDSMERFALTNVGSAPAHMYTAYDAFVFTKRDKPVSFSKRLAVGETLKATNKATKSFTVTANDQHHYAIYSGQNKVEKFGRLLIGDTYSVAAAEHIVLTNSGAANLTISGAEDAFILSEQVDPALYKGYLPVGSSSRITSTTPGNFNLDIEGTYDQASYKQDGALRSFDRLRSSKSLLLYGGERITITGAGTAMLQWFAPYEAVSVQASETPALALRKLTAEQSVEFTNKTVRSENINFTGNYDMMDYEADGAPGTYARDRSINYRSVEAGQRIAVMSRQPEPIEVYGAYEVFTIKDRKHPVTFKHKLPAAASLELTNTSNKAFSIYNEGNYNFALYDVKGNVADVERSYKSKSKLVSSGNRLALTNSLATNTIIEGPYDVFQVKERALPAIFEYELKPGASMEATLTSTPSAEVKMTGIHDMAKYDPQGKLTYYQNNRKTITTEKLVHGEKAAVQNSDVQPIIVYGAYDPFRVQVRENPVTFKRHLQADDTIKLRNKLNKMMYVDFEGTYDFAQYNAEGEVSTYYSNQAGTTKSIHDQYKMVVSPTIGQSVTVSGAFDAFEIVNHKDRAVTIKTMQPMDTISFYNISAGPFAPRADAQYEYQIFDAAGTLQSSGKAGGGLAKSFDSTERKVITNAQAVPITVELPTDAIRWAADPNQFFLKLLSGNSIEVTNATNAPQELTVRGKYDIAVYDGQGKAVRYSKDALQESIEVLPGQRVVLTSTKVNGTVVTGNKNELKVVPVDTPALVHAQVGIGKVLEAANISTEQRALTIVGDFKYRILQQPEQIGYSPMTIPAGQTVTIRSSDATMISAYAPYDFFRFVEKDAPPAPISGSAGADQIAKLEASDYDPQSFHADPIDTSTGAQIINRTLLTAHGAVPIPFQTQYHSLLKGDAALGKAWGHNYELRLEVNEAGDALKIYRNAFHSNTFKQQADGSYKSDDKAVKLDKVEKQADGGYVWSRNKGTTYHFDSVGRLTEMKDKTGQGLQFQYDAGGLKAVVDPFTGAALTFSYNANGDVSSVKDQANREVTFGYDAARRLTQITDAAGRVTNYAYDAQDRIVSAESEGTKLFVNEYDSEGRVVKQQDALAGSKPTLFAYQEADGKLITTITDRNGDIFKRTHNSSYQLLAVEDALGRTTSYTYDEAGNRTSMTNPLKQTARYSYDERGNVISAVDHMNQAITMTYDQANNLLTATGPDKKTIVNMYDQHNRLISVTDPEQGKTTYAYDANGLLQSVTNAQGSQSLYKYTGNRVSTVQNSEGETLHLGYDDAGRLVSEKDEAGNTTKVVYLTDDQLSTETDAIGNTIRYTYDKQGFLASTTDGRGFKTSFAYDGNGKLTQVTNAKNETSAFGYDGEGRLNRVTNPLGNFTAYQHDAIGNVIAATNAEGETFKYEYDALNRLTAVEDASGVNVYRVAYDAAGNMKSQSNAMNETWTYMFDENNRLTQSIDPLQRQTAYTYDGMNRLNGVTDPLQGQTIQQFDTLGRLQGLTDPNGNAAGYTYDRIGRLTGQSNASGGNEAYAYNPLGQLVTSTNARSQVTTYHYDPAGRLASFTDPTGEVTYTRDENGNVVEQKENNGNGITRTFDELNRVTQYVDQDGQRLKYVYDAAGRLTTLIYPDGKAVKYTYDRAGRMKTVTDWANRVTTYSYDANGRLITTERPNGTLEKREYNPAGRLIKLTDTRADGTLLHGYTYTYDAVGNVLTEQELAGASVTANVYGTNGTSGTSMSGQPIIDINGPGLSPMTQTVPDAEMTYTTDNRMATFNGQAVTYDADGNLINGPLDGSMQLYTYDARNRLIEAGGVKYGYNSDNIRTSVSANGVTTKYVVNPEAMLSQVLMETNEQGQAQTYYVYGLGLIGREDTSGGYATYHYDRRGSTKALTNLVGEVTDTYTYGYYGEALGHKGVTEQPFRYNGRDGVMTDSNGLYQMRARYYHPELKRFVNRDIVRGSIDQSQTLNRFAYVNGNPISYIDPFGLSRDGDSPWIQGGDFLVDTMPGIGTAKGFQQAFSGYNHITGEKLSTAERWAEGVGATASFIPIPGMKHAGKYVTEGAFWAGSKIKNFFGWGSKKVDDVACNCFTAGTKVLTDEGEKPIEEIEVGDKVLAKSDETGEVAYKEVVGLFQKQADKIYKVHIGDEVIEATAEHPFWLEGKGWAEVKDLKVGDLLVTSDGTTLAIDKIEKEPREATVYNFEVADFQSYFVSNLGIWVHNCAVRANYGKLMYDGDGNWISTAGLIYGQGSAEGNRVKHVLAHGIPNPTKRNHTVFNVGKDKILGLVDEAWSNKSGIMPVMQSRGTMVYNIPMGKVVGTNGETSIRIVVDQGTSDIVTAFPVR
ncbi:polymorphic toxin-type HINT domain-containing protein [Paenibacillus sp. SC116]|uniref:polymorphic toxin-type HINT domain-containing protein n=1 Tax=Paenibacillus sp. SC116 TaxID=2968986 RepID=UPI00215A730C|nr:polymorphic toxin-type HINT domain-containing protein [Paenibacillus sp. SC116]MCR8845337.1 polymorphic toxin-type HINT domain-containing protein [Paenibacillus sp. SC116]